MSVSLDLSQVPFTRYGSYLAFSYLQKEHSRDVLYLRSVHGPALGGRPLQELFKVELTEDGEPIPYKIIATPYLLTLEAESGRVEIVFASPSSIRLRTKAVSVSFEMEMVGEYDYLFPCSDTQWQVVVNTVCETKLIFSVLKGQLHINAPWHEEHCQLILLTLQPEDQGGLGEFQLDEFVIDPEQSQTHLAFEECIQHTKLEFEKWTASLPKAEFLPGPVRELGSYVLWSCFVKPSGVLSQDTLYASKNGMLGLWSWDHCFFTRAFYKSFPHLAWEQFLVPFKFQSRSGALPDFVNDRYVSWSFCKPPVHGWVLKFLAQDRNFLDREKIKEIYEPLSLWTNWWFAYRNYLHDGLPFYNHGNDSGWDNSTLFINPPPIQSPDLASFLVLQTEFLAFAAQELGLQSESAEWLEKSTLLRSQLITHFWKNDHFVAFDRYQHPVETKSLQLFLPLILGKRLPSSIVFRMVESLLKEEGFVTQCGLATESINSPHYRSRGYWRGPIWPAPTLILYDAIKACGWEREAAEIKEKFYKLIFTSGFAENYDAMTGEGYHDFHFSWTASVFFSLLEENDPSNRAATPT